MALLCFLLFFTLAAAVPASPPPLTFELQRAVTNHSMQQLSLRRIRDFFRHRPHLPKPNHVASFPLQGNPEPIDVGIYYTKVLLGSPPREFHVMIDTGSDVTWISCAPCIGCPTSSKLPIQLNNFDPWSSSTSSAILCSDQMCRDGSRSNDAGCEIGTNQCGFEVKYADGSMTSGRYVSDLMHFAGFANGSVAPDSSLRLVFGCSGLQTGGLVVAKEAVDGILGLGNHDISVISQLSSQGIVPRVFSHCLRGDSSGGGTLIFGEIVEPTIVYSPIIPSQSHYSLDLRSISVNGVMLKIDPAIFATSSHRGAAIDSGTTLAYLPEAAYDAFVDAITAAVPQSVRTVGSLYSEFDHCYLTNTTSISHIFPQASINFAGASLVLRPQDYLIREDPKADEPDTVWCIGFQKIQGGNMTILGDLVLKDKIVVYDLANQRIGFAYYDCSLPFNVTATTSNCRRNRANVGEMWVMTFLLTMLLI